MANISLEQSVERWLPIPGWEGAYEISTHGRIKSLPRAVPFYSACARVQTVRRVAGSILKWHTQAKDGYPRIALCRDGREEKWLIHRLVALTFLGPCPFGQDVAHLDGIKNNPRLDNLCYATRSENMQHKIGHGTYGWKLGPQDIATIRESCWRTATPQELAIDFGVTDAHIRLVARGGSWSKLPIADAAGASPPDARCKVPAGLTDALSGL
ncbi:MAG: NUMOD4 motif-containing HNH endonuclease [Myxococcota bacterium]|jgi:hypothetical protein